MELNTNQAVILSDTANPDHQADLPNQPPVETYEVKKALIVNDTALTERQQAEQEAEAKRPLDADERAEIEAYRKEKADREAAAQAEADKKAAEEAEANRKVAATDPLADATDIDLDDEDQRASLMAEVLRDPKAALEKYGKAHVKRAEAAVSAQRAAQNKAYEELQQAVPEARAISNDPKFKAWVESNENRAARFKQAGATVNVKDMAELMETFKQVSAVPAPKAGTADDPFTGEEGLGVAMANAGTRTAPAVRIEKRFSRSEMRDLMAKDKDHYDSAYAAQYRKAIEDGRVDE